jgi:hypothetical protein
MFKSSLKLIAVTFENYQNLKDLGRAGDSFNDVVSKLIRLQKLNDQNPNQVKKSNKNGELQS